MLIQNYLSKLQASIKREFLKNTTTVALAFTFLVIVVYQLPVAVDNTDWRNSYIVARDIWHYDRYDFIGIPLILFLIQRYSLFLATQPHLNLL